MTEYWVSQGNKWCDFCKIYISNNPASIRTHELGQRHKENVAKRITDIRKENAAKEKEQKDAAKALQQIEAKARRSYEKDLAAFRESKDSISPASQTAERRSEIPKTSSRDEWKFGSTSGYYYNQSNEYHYDPNSSLYYSEAIDDKHSAKFESGPPPGKVVTGPVNPVRSIKGAASSITVNKRKREFEKPKSVSKEEKDALKAREAAKKRVAEREAPLLGLYNSY